MSAGSSRLARWRAFSPAQRWAFCQAWCWLPLMWAALKAWPLPRLHARLMAHIQHLPPPTSAQLAEARALGEAVNAAARHTPFPATCLSRSLVLLWMLGRRGVAAQLCVGARLQNGQLDAHAWVEILHQPVNDRPDVALVYPPFDGFATSLAFNTR